jgi:hypothetical protein
MKINYCARCGRKIQGLLVVWQDEARREYKYHGMCSGAAEAKRKEMEDEIMKANIMGKWKN